jgi:nucleotide-binding universal stress UspA family protein
VKHTSSYRERFDSPGLVSWGWDMGNLATSAPIAFKNILFATDFSSTTELALPYALQIARRSGGTIHAVHVIAPDVYPLVPPSEWAKMAQEEKEFREKKRTELEEALHDVPHQFLLPSGDVWDNLETVIEEEDIDLVVLGTHGRTGVEKILLGSVAEKIFRRAHCPVLTVGPGLSSKTRSVTGAGLRRILYATDFGPESLAAAPYAVCLAKEHGAELILVHSIHTTESGQVDTAFQTLRDVVPSGAGLEFKPTLVVAHGAPQATILEAATKHDADLIVLGVRSGPRYSAVIAHFPRSIVYLILAEAPCPVLTIRG